MLLFDSSSIWLPNTARTLFFLQSQFEQTDRHLVKNRQDGRRRQTGGWNRKEQEDGLGWDMFGSLYMYVVWYVCLYAVYVSLYACICNTPYVLEWKGVEE